MGATTHLQKLSSAARAHLDELLDEALAETFPASDPVAIAVGPGTVRDRLVTGIETIGTRYLCTS